jgi:hypothetical protein
MPGSDPDDRSHAAAPVARASCVVLTKNAKDFPAGGPALRGVVVREPDDYLVELFDRHPDELVHIVREMAADRGDRPMTVTEIVDALALAAVSALANRLRHRLSG